MTLRSKILLLGLLSAFSVAGYLVASKLFYGIGFPLDDSWIHQTYARNLAEAAEWTFFRGQPSGGSTSPLWAALLAPGHLFGVGPYVWTFTLGWLVLWGLSILSVHVFELIAPTRKDLSIWIGIVMIFEWHLVWAAVSGMETLLFALCVMAIFALLAQVNTIPAKRLLKHWAILGILIGISAWVRPEGIVMLGVASIGIILFANGEDMQGKTRKFAGLGFGFLLTFGPYLLFNQMISGDWWPNTFYAKQAEYAVLRSSPLLQRYVDQFGLLLIGMGAVLLPGFALYLYHSIRERKWAELLPAFWVLGHLGLYALRLPVTYQHGRYVIPAMPLFFLLGLAGAASWIRPNSREILHRVLSRAWLVSIGLVAALFWWLGASAYSRDVAVIESEMVGTARWVANNTTERDVVAAHDIGALGYFTDRPLLDLAGLVSPDVVTFIRDEGKLSEYLIAKGATHLVTFPSLYPELVRQSKLIYETEGEISPLIGGENMKVYLWGEP